MQFTKMHGTGNDFICVNGFEEPFPDDPAELARRMTDRHFGVGGDGLVLICPSEKADARMRMFNVDGSEAEMCGNGIRCVGKFLYDHDLCRRDQPRIETGAGILSLELFAEAGRVQRVRVDMGRPILEADRIPTTLPGYPVVNRPLEIAGRRLEVTCVSMSNPHAVTFVEQLDDDWIHLIGRQVETDSHFPNRINAEFVEILSPVEVRMRVWERGCGETLACGTGASAVCVAGVLSGRTERKIRVHLLGGDLDLEWIENGSVMMTGPAEEVFTGSWSL